MILFADNISTRVQNRIGQQVNGCIIPLVNSTGKSRLFYTNM